MRAVAQESWALTLWTYIHVREIEEFERVAEEGDRIDLASLVGVAFHEPERLKQIDRTWRERARLLRTLSSKEALDRGVEMAKRILRMGLQ